MRSVKIVVTKNQGKEEDTMTNLINLKNAKNTITVLASEEIKA